MNARNLNFVLLELKLYIPYVLVCKAFFIGGYPPWKKTRVIRVEGRVASFWRERRRNDVY